MLVYHKIIVLHSIILKKLSIISLGIKINRNKCKYESVRQYPRKAVIVMLKSISRFLLFFVIMLAVAAAAGCITYLITLNSLKASVSQTPRPATVSANTAAAADVSASAPKETEAPMKFDYYIVRLEGENLGVYASCGGREEFLYNENIYLGDLSDGDRTLLQNGVTLKNSSELTAFMENFTS